jgi:hypothetical protein
LEPRFAGSNPANWDVVLRAIKSTACLPLERKYSSQPHAVIFYGMLKNPLEFERDTL